MQNFLFLTLIKYGRRQTRTDGKSHFNFVRIVYCICNKGKVLYVNHLQCITMNDNEQCAIKTMVIDLILKQVKSE